MKKHLHSDKAPKPIGPYVHAIGLENLIFTSGMVGFNREGIMVSDDVSEQTRQTIENIKNILEDNDSSLENIVKASVFLKDMNDFSAMNLVYESYFGKSLPARSTVEVSRLPKDAKVEIDVIAHKN